MPSVLHEAMFDNMKQFVGQTIGTLPYDRTVINPIICMTWPLEVKDGIVMPDIIITANAIEGPTEVFLIPFHGECVLSETDKHVFEKMEKVIHLYPDIICMVVVLVHKATNYTSPKNFQMCPISCMATPTMITCNLTLLDHSSGNAAHHVRLGQPIIIASHTWCHLSSVEYFVWTREGEAPIDFCSQDPAHMAYGVSFHRSRSFKLV